MLAVNVYSLWLVSIYFYALIQKTKKDQGFIKKAKKLNGWLK